MLNQATMPTEITEHQTHTYMYIVNKADRISYIVNYSTSNNSYSGGSLLKNCSF